MKIRIVAGVVGLMVALTAARAEEAFSKAIAPEDFTAAELDKLSPEALARLDRLVQAYRSGAVATARAEAEKSAAAAALVREEAAEKEAAKKSTPGFFARAKVALTPGTEVEYQSIDSRIAGKFRGWEGRTTFTLENGQRWQVANGGNYFTPPVDSPKVTISPASFGGFWMKIEGVTSPVKVLLISH